MNTVELDCVGLCCPMPLVRIKRAMDEMNAGDCLKITASDPAFEADIKAWTEKFGHAILSIDIDEHITAVVRKAA
ncbi:MAG: sulfurtransferase TusA family protein [Phycisphaeraceae bacterium JB051]